jgi:hypothetical protein
MPPLDGDLPHHDAQRYMLKFTGGSVDHEFVLAGDYDSLLRELARCQARIGELEVQVQQWKERAKQNA